MRINLEVATSFAVAALLEDGLTVTPFDAHHGGSGVLERAGLTPALWREWVQRLVDLRRELSGTGTPSLDMAAAEQKFLPLFEPPLSCPGPQGLRDSLAELWIRRRDGLDSWKRTASSILDGRYWESVRRELKGISRDDAQVYVAAYVTTVAMPVASGGYVLGVRDGETPAYVGRLLQVLQDTQPYRVTSEH